MTGRGRTFGYVVAVEAIARYAASTAIVMVAGNLKASILAAHATLEQRDRFVRRAARGECDALSSALTEPVAGSDAWAISTPARQDDDARTLDGAKLASLGTCGRVVDRMLQLHSGKGYSEEYEIERLYRDGRVMRMCEGTSEIKRELTARAVVGAT